MNKLVEMGNCDKRVSKKRVKLGSFLDFVDVFMYTCSVTGVQKRSFTLF